jgi:plasmid replication initiation protein
MNYDENIRIEQAREYKIVKDNKLIQNVTKRKYELSVLEQKVLGFILSMIKPPENITSQPLYQYEFDIRTFCKVCGIDFNSGTNYRNVKAALKKLADNSFWMEEDDDELLFQWITTPRIKKKSGKVTIKISDDVMPYLYKLQERFTTYELYQILALKGSYSIALYELCKSYAFRKKIVLSIDDVKKYLSIEDKYKEYKAFRRKIIEPAVKEINEFTDLDVSWQPIKKGRFYVAIDFHISAKKRREGYEAYRRTMVELHGTDCTEG